MTKDSLCYECSYVHFALNHVIITKNARKTLYSINPNKSNYVNPNLGF